MTAPLPDELLVDAYAVACKARYEKEKKIGEGTYAIVYVGRQVATGERVAIKKIKWVAGGMGLPLDALREIRWLQSVNSPYILPLYETYVLKGALHLVLAYAPHDLSQIIGDKRIVLMPADVKSWLWMLLQALAACHESWVMHRDVKPSNLLVREDGRLWLADFGLARDWATADHPPMTSAVVTRWYQAPELLMGARHYTPAIDLWSAGCVLAELLLRVPYLPGDSTIGQLHTIFRARGSPTAAEWPFMTSLPDYVALPWYPRPALQAQFRAASPDVLDLLDKLLTLDPTKRLSARQALLHPYFVNLPLPTPPQNLPKPISSTQSTHPTLQPRKLFLE
jgi:cyclin-dependent kinase 7